MPALLQGDAEPPPRLGENLSYTKTLPSPTLQKPDILLDVLSFYSVGLFSSVGNPVTPLFAIQGPHRVQKGESQRDARQGTAAGGARPGLR